MQSVKSKINPKSILRISSNYYSLFKPTALKRLETLLQKPKPKTSFSEYVKEQMVHKPAETSIRDYWMKITEKWNNLSEEERKKRANTASKYYTTEKTKFNANLTDNKKSLISLIQYHYDIEAGKISMDDIPKKDLEIFKQIPRFSLRNSRDLFLSEQIKENLTLGDAAKKWDTLSINEKEEYRQKYETKNTEYLSLAQNWLNC